MAAKAFGKTVIAQLDQRIEKTTGGIIVPQQAQANMPWATVLSVGEAVSGIAVGDRVMYKDAVTFSRNGAVVTNNTAVFTDVQKRIVAIDCEQIIVTDPAGATGTIEWENLTESA